ncbi:MAG: hypothetical protein H7A51_16235 [Akkermansiaceae bacterium]|nr:hypothetical protein [Akkermansiaceae bacterium]
MKAIIPILAIAALMMTSLPSCGPAIIPPPVPHPPGVGLRVLPYGYRTVYVGGVPYYYNGSHWYRRSHGRYISCPRPRGYVPRVRGIPAPPRPPGLPGLPHIRL